MFQIRKPPLVPSRPMQFSFSPHTEQIATPSSQRSSSKGKLAFQNPFLHADEIKQPIGNSRSIFLEELRTLASLLGQVGSLPATARSSRIIMESVRSHAREYRAAVERFRSSPGVSDREVQEAMAAIELVLAKFLESPSGDVRESQVSNVSETSSRQSRRDSQPARIKDQITRGSSINGTPRRSGVEPTKLIKLNEELRREMASCDLTYAGQVIQEIAGRLVEQIDHQETELLSALETCLERGLQQLRGKNGTAVDLYRKLSEIEQTHQKRQQQRRESLSIVSMSAPFGEKENVMKQKSGRYTEPSQPSQPSPSQPSQPSQSAQNRELKLKFYNVALQRKSKYEMRPGARTYLLVELFEEYLSRYSDDRGIESFLASKFGE